MNKEELVPIGTRVLIKDDEDNYGTDSGKWKTVTRYCDFAGGYGYRLDNVDDEIFLNCDFVDSKLPETEKS